jgi:hypothetical protein
MIFGPVVTQVLGKNTLRGKTHPSFLPPSAANPSSPCFTVSARLSLAFISLGLQLAGWRRGGEGHAKVGANYVDDGLAVRRIVLSEPFECIQAAGPDRGLVTAELLNRLGVELGDAPLGRVKVAPNYRELRMMAAAEGEHPQPGQPWPPRWPGALMCPPAMRELHGKHHLAAIMSIAGGQPGLAAARAARARCQLSPGPPAVPWPVIPGRWDCRCPSASRRRIQARSLMRDVTGARLLRTAIAGVVGSQQGPDPRRRALTSSTSRARGEEQALLWPPSLTAAGEPHPLPMERTSLTLSVGICASTEDHWPLLQSEERSIGTQLLRGE